MDRIELFLNAIEYAAGVEGEIVPWPIHVARVAPYFSDLEASYMYTKAKLLESTSTPKRVLGQLFPGPSAVKTTMLDLIIGLKASDEPIIPVEERVWYINYIFDMLETMQAGDIFCRDLTNRILTENDAQKLFETTPWKWASDQMELARLSQRVSAGSLSLIWSLYFYPWPNVGFEIHGPYEVITRDGKTLKLLIRDFFDTKPTLLWEKPAFPHDSIRILTLYKPEADLSVDIYNHLVHKANLLDSTVGVSIEVNGHSIQNSGEANDLHKELLSAVKEQNKLVESLPEEDLIKKFIESRYYVYRKIKKHFGEDWYPHPRAFDRIRRWGILQISPSGPPDWNMLKKSFDPRTDFYPGKS